MVSCAIQYDGTSTLDLVRVTTASPHYQDRAPLSASRRQSTNLLIPLIMFTFVYFGLNSGLITVAVAFETGLSPYGIWRENFRWVSLNYFCGASVALLLVVYTRDVDLPFIGVIVPLLLVLYFTIKTSMDRVEDANRHVGQVNRLYLIDHRNARNGDRRERSDHPRSYSACPDVRGWPGTPPWRHGPESD